MQTIYQDIELNETQFTTVINELRKANKDKWIAWVGTVKGKAVRFKGYGLFIQIFDVDSIRHGGTDCKSVLAWVAELRKPFE